MARDTNDQPFRRPEPQGAARLTSIDGHARGRAGADRRPRVKSLRLGRVSINEAFAAEQRRRVLAAQRLFPGIRGAPTASTTSRGRAAKTAAEKREIVKLHQPDRSATASPWCRSRSISTNAAVAKMQLGLAHGRRQADKRAADQRTRLETRPEPHTCATAAADISTPSTASERINPLTPDPLPRGERGMRMQPAISEFAGVVAVRERGDGRPSPRGRGVGGEGVTNPPLPSHAPSRFGTSQWSARRYSCCSASSDSYR